MIVPIVVLLGFLTFLLAEKIANTQLSSADIPSSNKSFILFPTAVFAKLRSSGWLNLLADSMYVCIAVFLYIRSLH
jgi:hypothetical protein